MMNKIKVGDIVTLKVDGASFEIIGIGADKVGRYFLCDPLSLDYGYCSNSKFYEKDFDIMGYIDMSTQKGMKHDSDKPDLSLVDKSFVESAARALGFGANKYGRDNYKNGLEIERLYASLLRHIFARMSGEINDLESGLDHLDHIAANVNMITTLKRLGKIK